MRFQATAWVILAALAALSGCTEGEDEGFEGASLTFEGTGDGGHEDQLDCDGGAQLTGAGNVDEGQVMVFVVDGSSENVFTGTYSDPIDVEGEAIPGEGGTWSLQVERMGGFSGSYAFGLVCG